MLGPEYFTEIYILNCNFILWQLYWDRGLQYKKFRLIGIRGVQFFQRKGEGGGVKIGKGTSMFIVCPQ
jgi:hypothetical protein